MGWWRSWPERRLGFLGMKSSAHALYRRDGTWGSAEYAYITTVAFKKRTMSWRVRPCERAWTLVSGWGGGCIVVAASAFAAAVTRGKRAKEPQETGTRTLLVLFNRVHVMLVRSRYESNGTSTRCLYIKPASVITGLTGIGRVWRAKSLALPRSNFIFICHC